MSKNIEVCFLEIKNSLEQCQDSTCAYRNIKVCYLHIKTALSNVRIQPVLIWYSSRALRHLNIYQMDYRYRSHCIDTIYRSIEV